MPTSLLGPIGQIAITVRDLERAVAFYRDKLGLPLLFQVPGMAFFDCQGIRLMLSLSEKPGEAYSSILYYRAEDIRLTYEALRGRDVKGEGEPHLVAPMPTYDLWMAFLRDSEDNMFALMSEIPRVMP